MVGLAARQALKPGPRVEEEEVVEIRTGLGFTDLARQDTADERIVKRFTDTLPGYALERADRWRDTALSQTATLFPAMWQGEDRDRADHMEMLRAFADQFGGYELDGGW